MSKVKSGKLNQNKSWRMMGERRERGVRQAQYYRGRGDGVMVYMVEMVDGKMWLKFLKSAMMLW